MGHTAESLQNAFHYFFPGEVPAFKSIIHELPPNPIIINIGAGAGTSGLAVVETRPDSYLITIDITKESSPFGCLYGEEIVLKDAGLWKQQRWHPKYNFLTHRNFQLHMSSTEWHEKEHPFKDILPDFVYIDGNHSYEGCKEDIEIYTDLLSKKGGVVSVHDYNKQMLDPDPNGPHPKAWVGVNQAVDELLLPNYSVLSYVDSLITFRIP